MRNFIYNTKTDTVLAKTDTEDRAHALAECISYMEHSNSTYGLFGITLKTRAELMADDLGRLALFNFDK